jgi:hypothetical protein
VLEMEPDPAGFDTTEERVGVGDAAGTAGRSRVVICAKDRKEQAGGNDSAREWTLSPSPPAPSTLPITTPRLTNPRTYPSVRSMLTHGGGAG